MRRIALLLVLLSLPSGVEAAVTHDATSVFNLDADTTPYAFTHTVGSGSNRLLLCMSAITGSIDVTAITYNGDSLTFLDTAANSGRTVEVWYLINPDTGSNTVSMTGDGTANGMASCTSFHGVDQTTPLGTQTTTSGVASSTSRTITVPTDGGGYDAVAHSTDTCPAGATATGDQTDRASQCNTANSAGGAVGTTLTSGSRTHSWSFSAASNYGQVAVPINPAAAAAPRRPISPLVFP